MQCAALTTKKQYCKNITKKNKKYCSLHLTECNNLYKDYKNLCKISKCFKKMDIEQLKNIKKRAKQCINKRKKFEENCICVGDKGHQIFVQNMKNAANNCNRIIKLKTNLPSPIYYTPSPRYYTPSPSPSPKYYTPSPTY